MPNERQGKHGLTHSEEIKITDNNSGLLSCTRGLRRCPFRNIRYSVANEIKKNIKGLYSYTKKMQKTLETLA